jgi:hypothetical protein
MENTMEATGKTKNRTAVGSSNTMPQDIPTGM